MLRRRSTPANSADRGWRAALSGASAGIAAARPLTRATRSSTARASSPLPLRFRYIGDSGT